MGNTVLIVRVPPLAQCRISKRNFQLLDSGEEKSWNMGSTFQHFRGLRDWFLSRLLRSPSRALAYFRYLGATEQKRDEELAIAPDDLWDSRQKLTQLGGLSLGGRRG